MGRRTTLEQREFVLSLHRAGYKERLITAETSIHRSTVRKIIQRFIVENRLADKKGKLAPNKIFTAQEELQIINLFHAQPTLSAPKLAEVVAKELGKPCSPEVLRRLLRVNNISGRKAWCRRNLGQVNTQRRLQFATEFQAQGPAFWESVMFVGTAKFHLIASAETSYVQSKWNNERQPCGGGGIIVWGCFSSAGVGNIVFKETKMSTAVLLATLAENLLQSAEDLELGKQFHYYHEIDASHKSPLVHRWLAENCPGLFVEQPAQSPDLNGIENLWPMLDQGIRERGHKIDNMMDLRNAIMYEWHQITPDITRALAHSMPDRLQEVVANQGGHTRY
ncbi:hypothetical protein KR032_005229 [Drosophila birchii]|nr:hypothetical protein KR032_005229 [Drosophila birchii]